MDKPGKRPSGAVPVRPAQRPPQQTKRQSAVRQQPAAHAERSRGAARHKVEFSDKRRSWLRHHLGTAREALQRLKQSPISTLMTVAVLAIALALPGFLLTGLKNLQQLGSNWGGEPRVSLYLQSSLDDQQADRFSRSLLLRDDLLAVELVSREQALLEFSQSSGLGDLLGYLGENPLPATILVLPRETSAAGLSAIQQRLQALPEVEEAVLDLAWVQRLASIVELLKRSAWVLGGLLALTVLLVVGNTIRMTIGTRRDEIEVAKLVGATDAWVRRPFLYTGFWLGLIGGVTAWLLIQLSLMLIDTPARQLVALYQGEFELLGLGWVGSFILLLSSLMLGWLGAWLAVAKHLREIEPE